LCATKVQQGFNLHFNRFQCACFIPISFNIWHNILENWFFQKESFKLTFYRNLKSHQNQGCGKCKHFLLHYRVVFIFLYNELPNIEANNIYLSCSIWSPSRLGWPLWTIRVTKGHKYMVCRNHNQPFHDFPHFYYTNVRRRIQRVEHELITFLEHLCPPVHQCISSPGKNQMVCGCYKKLRLLIRKIYESNVPKLWSKWIDTRWQD